MTDRHDVWDSGSAYEAYVGRWSRVVAAEFLDWLAVSAGSQRTIEGWVARKRPGTPAAEAAARAADPAIDVHGGTAR